MWEAGRNWRSSTFCQTKGSVNPFSDFSFCAHCSRACCLGSSNNFTTVLWFSLQLKLAAIRPEVILKIILLVVCTVEKVATAFHFGTCCSMATVLKASTAYLTRATFALCPSFTHNYKTLCSKSQKNTGLENPIMLFMVFPPPSSFKKCHGHAANWNLQPPQLIMRALMI